MDRIILHIDANCFFASVETAYNPALKDKPVAVCGDKEARHGIILTANYIAKRGFGIKTGDIISNALAKCPDLVLIKSNPQKYVRHSRLMREILADYSSFVEPFGSDEAWVDITDIAADMKSAEKIAYEISARIKRELHITVSIGVSFSKVFAKFGSDYKKPDAVTVISRENYRDIVWKSPCDSLLFIGRATKARLASRGIFTIGDIARTSAAQMKSYLGKNGLMLRNFALGYDGAAVRNFGISPKAKSIGNSVTASRDLVTDNDVKRIFFVLADSIARRLRESGLAAGKITISLRRNDLTSFTHQCTLPELTDTAFAISDTAFALFEECYTLNSDKPLRSVGITASHLQSPGTYAQISLFPDDEKSQKRHSLELAMDSVRGHYGYYSICRASLLADKKLTQFDPKDEHILHPVGAFTAINS